MQDKVILGSHRPYHILGDPLAGATSRDNALFLGESLLQELKSPWELIVNEPVPEVVEFRPADWAEKYFSAQSARTILSGNSVAFLHEVVFFIDLVLWPVQREDCGDFRKNIQRSRVNRKPIPFILWADLWKVYRKFL